MTQPISLGDAIASQVRAYRTRKGWSVRQLAEVCEKLGAAQLTAASLANIERGQDPNAKRSSRRVLVEELFVLARALDVSPIMLVFPIGQEESIRVLPDLATPTWRAAQWFMGDRALTDDPEDFGWEASAAPLKLFCEHEDVLDERLMNEGMPQTTLDMIDKRLREVRRDMRRVGVRPPALPEELAHIDAPRPARRTADE